MPHLLNDLKRCIWRLIVPALLAFPLVTDFGCERSSSFSAKVTVLDDGGRYANDDGDRNKPAGTKGDRNHVRMEGNQLYANGKYYGEVESGAAILLDRDGQVYVNGKKRKERK